MLASLAVLLPRDGLVFALDAPILYEELYKETEAEAHRRLAYWLQDYRSINQDTITNLTAWFRVAVGSLVVEIVLLALAFALH